jgi:hypothetical protein
LTPEKASAFFARVFSQRTFSRFFARTFFARTFARVFFSSGFTSAAYVYKPKRKSTRDKFAAGQRTFTRTSSSTFTTPNSGPQRRLGEAEDTTPSRDRGSADKRERGARARLGRGKADAEPVVDFAQVG